MLGSFKFLGTGASLGVPIIGCHCSVCSSQSKKNKRSRPAGLLKIQDKVILVDVGPDFRSQALLYEIERLDGLMITHSHYDHIGGIDDLRVYYFHNEKALPTLLNVETYREIKKRFSYLFSPDLDPFSRSEKFAFQLVKEDFEIIEFLGLKIQAISYFQAKMKVMGFRYHNFAYLSDIKEYSQDIFKALKGVDTMVISAVRHKPTPVHFNLEEAIAFSKKTEAKKVYFTHIAHNLDHEKTSKELPSGFFMGYDGLEIPIEEING
ncbi:MAG: MBL fold metallo-hydrolase [Simkaniaceae bacterium]